MKEKVLYLECSSGISGDMTVGALLDLGADEEKLRDELSRLRIGGFELKFSRRSVRGIDAFDFDVILREEPSGCGGEHSSGHRHHHHHRTMREIRELIVSSGLSEGVKDRALKIFTVLAEAEGKVHGKPAEEVGFHEVGAVDSIVDIVGTAVCLENLGIDKIVYSEVCEGRGQVRCQHGWMPVPVPAVLELARAKGISLRLTGTEGEMVTPTGAAILAALAVREEDPLRGRRIAGIGIGAGKKEFPHANILRAVLLEGEQEKKEKAEQVWVLESNVDDSSGEELGYCIERLLEAGAKDACCIPIWMKKHRPAYLLQVICDEQHREKLENIIFRETTSIGLRKYLQERSVLPRKTQWLESSLGPVRVKLCRHLDQIFAYPEYEDAAEIAEKTGMPISRVLKTVRQEAACPEASFRNSCAETGNIVR